jgi:hypothetical protein
MRSTTVFLAAAVLALVFGLSFLLAPGPVLSVYGAATEPATLLMARFFGVALLQLGVALYLLKDVRDATVVRGLAMAGVVGSTAGVIVALLGVVGGVVNALGWSTVVIYGLLLLGYASCLRGRTSLA